MNSKIKISNKNISNTKKDRLTQKASKTWLAMIKNAGAGKINDRDAVLK